MEVKCNARIVMDVGLPRTGTFNFAAWTATLGYDVHHFIDRRNITRQIIDSNYSLLFDNVPVRGLSFSDNPWAEDACVIHAHQPHEMDGMVKYVLMKRRDGAAWRNSLKHMACEYWMFRNQQKMKDFCLHKIHKTWPKMGIMQALGKHWCKHSMEQGAKKFCKAELSNAKELHAEAEVASNYMQKHIKRIRECIPKKDLLEVQLDDVFTKTKEMAEFLGCHGTVPPYPQSDQEVHALLQNFDIIHHMERLPLDDFDDADDTSEVE